MSIRIHQPAGRGEGRPSVPSRAGSGKSSRSGTSTLSAPRCHTMDAARHVPVHMVRARWKGQRRCLRAAGLVKQLDPCGHHRGGGLHVPRRGLNRRFPVVGESRTFALSAPQRDRRWAGESFRAFSVWALRCCVVVFGSRPSGRDDEQHRAEQPAHNRHDQGRGIAGDAEPMPRHDGQVPAMRGRTRGL